MKTITVWESEVKQKNGELVWEHNHIEDGYDEQQNAPTVMDPYQTKVWKKVKWRKFEAQLTDESVVVLL